MSAFVHIVRAAAPDRLNGPDMFLRHLAEGLRMGGARVEEHTLGFYGRPGSDDRDAAMAMLAAFEDDARVLVEAAAVPALVFAVPREMKRLRLTATFHRACHHLDSLSPSERSRVLAAERDTYRHFDRVLTTSLWGAMALGPLGVLPDQIGLILPAADPMPEAPGADGRSLLMIGQVTRRKGHLAVLAALDPATPWHLTIAGSLAYAPDYVAELRTTIDARFADRVTLTGALSPAELRGQLHRADLLVSASTDDAAGLAVMDAVAAGVPALVTDVGGVAQTLPDHAGLVADDPVALGPLLAGWLQDPLARQRLKMGALQARKRIRTLSLARRELDRELEIADRLTGRLP
ncbi:MAG: glycosyltransferase family 4 protein [Myxococcota bacterium]